MPVDPSALAARGLISDDALENLLSRVADVPGNRGSYPPGQGPGGPEMAPRGSARTYTGASGEKIVAPVRGQMAGVNYEVTPEQADQLQIARKAGAGRAEIQKMVDSFTAKPASAATGTFPPELEDAYRNYKRGGPTGANKALFEARREADRAELKRRRGW